MAGTRVARRRAMPFLAMAALGLALTACGPSGTSSGGGTGSGSASPGSHASSSAPSQGSGGSAGTPLFPVASGDTWVYNVTIAGYKRGTTTNQVTAVVPEADGKHVTIVTHSDIAGLPTTPTSLSYIIHPDGSIAVPLAQVGNGTATIKSGSIVWPSQAILNSGKPHTSTLVMQIKVAGQSVTADGQVTVQGAGTHSVTVPAGTYQATLVNETIAEHVEGITVEIQVRTWLAPGVGPVKSEASTKTGTVTEVVSLEELRSFTKG